eukprot:697616-Rhodomonas_salina.2
MTTSMRLPTTEALTTPICPALALAPDSHDTMLLRLVLSASRHGAPSSGLHPRSSSSTLPGVQTSYPSSWPPQHPPARLTLALSTSNHSSTSATLPSGTRTSTSPCKAPTSCHSTATAPSSSSGPPWPSHLSSAVTPAAFPTDRFPITDTASPSQTLRSTAPLSNSLDPTTLAPRID